MMLPHPRHNHNVINSSPEIQSFSIKRPVKHVKIKTTNDCPTKKPKPETTTSDVLKLFDRLRFPIPPDIYTCLIKECIFSEDSSMALELHVHIKTSNFKPSVFFLNRLLLMHVSCGILPTARQLFDQMPVKDLYSWAIIVVAYIDVADYEESIALFVKMMKIHMLLEFPPWIIVCLLKACAGTSNVQLGKQLHGLLLKLGNAQNTSFMGSLIGFYGKFGCSEDANLVFKQLLHHNTVVWTAKMVNSCREGCYRDIFHDFIEMGREGINKNSFTFSSVLKACARLGDDGNAGRQVHANAVKIGIDSHDYVQCGLIDMYGKCGLVRDAMRVFEMIGNKNNAACWNAMLLGFVRNGFCVDAIKVLYKMKAAGIDVQDSLIEDVRIICGSADSCSTYP